MQPRLLLRALVVVGLSGIASAACSAPTDDAESSEAAASARSFKLATFNAGLVRGGVALADERLSRIAPALEETGADVLCLQEVWSDEDYEAIRAALATTYPHAFRKRTEENGRRWFSCNPFKLQGLKSCVDAQCTPAGVSAEECVQNACKEKYDALSDRCQICLASNTESPTKCLFIANEYVQDGRNGLVLFSKHPIGDARFEDYGTALVHRGLITATVEGKAIACTHLSSDLTTVPYPSGQPWKSWAEEQASQVDKVIEALPSSGCRVVMGDLNTSPDAGVIRPELPGTLASFAAKGFLERSSTSCTWCPPPENPLASGREAKTYDHVLVKDCGTQVKYERIMDQPIEVEHDGQRLTTRLSDHFGLMAHIPR